MRVSVGRRATDTLHSGGETPFLFVSFKFQTESTDRVNENVVLSLNEMRKREPNEKKVNEEIKIGELITSRVL